MNNKGEDMNEELRELGRRAVACKGWRWMEGMQCRWQDIDGSPWWEVRLNDETGAWEVVRFGTYDGEPIHRAAIPDLSDPATVGCLLALVREVWGDQGIHVILCQVTGLWAVRFGVCELPWRRTEAAALVAALEAAP